jgi:transglutaminase/protease-like cytokinesis protein 3
VKNRKPWLCSGLILLSLISFAQTRVTSSHKIDPVETSPFLLAQKLTAGAKTEKEKVTAIFRWITDNITYNSGIFYKTPRKAPILFPYNIAEDTGALPSLNDRVAEGVLRRRVAICDGYSRLFASLCHHAGIRSEIIHGYARTGMSNQSKFRSNHSWNAVMIDSAWHLLDATWASGYFVYGSNEFVPHYSNQYFLSDPNDFINDHYPEDLQWTLLPHPPTLKEFQKSPFKYGAFVKFKIQSYKPAEGIIEVMHGDSIHIELETGVKEKKLYVTAGIDSLGQFFDQENSAKINGQKISYTYKVSPASGEWLNVVYNGEPILRYKLLLKNRPLAGTTLKFKINE